MKLRFSLLVSSLVASLLFVGCSGSSKPSENAGEKFIQNKIKRQARGRIKLVSFEKTNGQMIEFGGQKVYKLEWKGTIEFLSDCRWGPMELGSWSGDFHTSAGENDNLGALGYAFAALKPANKGQKVPLTGDLTFEKTEKGWRGEDGNIY